MPILGSNPNADVILGAHHAGALCDVLQTCGQQAVLHGHIKLLLIFVRKQGVQIPSRQGQREQAAIFYQLCEKTNMFVQIKSVFPSNLYVWWEKDKGKAMWGRPLVMHWMNKGKIRLLSRAVFMPRVATNVNLSTESDSEKHKQH